MIAIEFYEDLYALGKSSSLRKRIDAQERVLNLRNTRRGVTARRGDATFGELIPKVKPVLPDGFSVARGAVANVEIGIEVKILAKAMIKQIGRVVMDMKDQVRHFRRRSGNPLCIGIAGINWAAEYTSYEKDRLWKTDGSSDYKHPIQEAEDAEAHLRKKVAPRYNELLILRYRATNAAPYAFEWVNREATELDYGAALLRISREYDKRFRNGNGQ